MTRKGRYGAAAGDVYSADEIFSDGRNRESEEGFCVSQSKAVAMGLRAAMGMDFGGSWSDED
jgi:hypothetical protein